MTINTLNTLFIADVDHKLNQVRDALGSLDATRAIGCNEADAAARAAAVVTIPHLKGIAIVAADGLQTCSSLPMSIAAVPEFADSATSLSSFERLDVVSLGHTIPLAIQLQRKAANSGASLAAIVPLSELVSWLDRAPARGVDLGHMRLSLGKRRLLDLSGGQALDDAAPPELPANADGAAAETTAAGDKLVLTAGSEAYPLSITTSVAVWQMTFSDTRRLVTDFALFAAFAGLLIIVFLRESGGDFGLARFDQAIRRKEFDVAYRPTIDLHSGKLAGAVIEMRWRRAGGIVLPSTDFMPAVVRSGFELQMLRYALRKSQEDLAAAYKLRLRLQLKVSIDHDTLLLPGFIEQIRRSLGSSTLRPSQLVLAVLPIGEAGDPQRSRAVLMELQRLGVQLEIRRATGLATLAQTHDDVTFSAIGIDFRLTQALDTDTDGSAEQARLWIRNIVASCASTSIRVCAYRIGSYGILKQLKDLGVHEVEGEVLAPPLTPGSFMALVARAGLDRNEPAVPDQGFRRAVKN